MALGLADLLVTCRWAAVWKQVAARSLGPRKGCYCCMGSVWSHLHPQPAAPTG